MSALTDMKKCMPRRETKLPDELAHFRRLLRNADILRVAAKVAEHYQLNIEDLAQHTRSKKVVEARHVAAFFHSFRAGVSFKAIGLIYNVSSTSITHSRDTVEDWCSVYADFRDKLAEIANSITSSNN